MYQIIVLGLGFSLLFGGAYYIKKSDGVGVLGQAFSNPVVTYKVPLTAEEVAGEYDCDITSGCGDALTVKLTSAGDAQMTTISDSGRELSNEEGSWKFEKGGIITLSFSDPASQAGEVTHTILIQSVSTSTLTKLVYDTKFYTNMHKPTFTRQRG